jgi:hypothetical protein
MEFRVTPGDSGYNEMQGASKVTINKKRGSSKVNIIEHINVPW